MQSLVGPAATRFGEFQYQGNAWVGLLVSILIVALFVHMAARIVLDRGGFLQALATTVVGFLLAGLVTTLVGGVLGTVLGIVVFGLVTSAFYRTTWLKALVIGLVAWALGLVVMFLLGLLLRL